MSGPIRIANCSGFFGDRPSGAIEMVDGGPIDVLTGDWLAELTMLILGRIKAGQAAKGRERQGFARTFVAQMEQVMGTCLDQGIRVVSNAGGLDPDGCAEAVADVADRLGLSPTIAYVDGDDLLARLDTLVADGDLVPFDDGTGGGLPDVSQLLTANAYLGCWGIVDALTTGADIVITGRVTDAAVTCGPAAWHHAWGRDDIDALAGAVVAGHVIECSAQATGGNYSFVDDDVTDWATNPRFGFPWAEIAADGSAVIGKHDGTGGAVTRGTVLSQLLYEIGGPAYLGPDVTARFDSIELDEVGPDRVRISGVRGEPAPDTLKVATNYLGGYRNSFSLALTGPDIDTKAALARATFWDACPHGPDDFAAIDDRIIRTDQPDPDTQETATALWRVTVKDPDQDKVGRAITDALIQTALASIPGLYALGGGPTAATPFGVYRPATVPAALVPARVHVLGSDEVTEVASAHTAPTTQPTRALPTPARSERTPDDPAALDEAEVVRVPLGHLVGTRSGDKGGNANLGVFVRSAAAWPWLDAFLTTEQLAELLPEAGDGPIQRHRFPNLWALNFVLVGLLQEGVAASTRQDAQAKALGEWLRSRVVPVPAGVLRDASP